MDDYPLLELFLTMLWFFFFVAWIWLLITLVADIFRSHDLSGWGKALWTLLIVILPVLGALIYLIARGEGMAERQVQDYERREQEFRSYVRDASSNGASTAEELTKLARLRDGGVITAEEFEAQKTKLLT
ncbi:SHOCT domain-containing protein [Haloactinopolyspora sp.]|uniref:SHOCT domain-containing protein n=1 Tax=Haloactinopolyspora sp. TaxID=1966353 RepID=UPI00261D07FD|nr:SHOCT domain-containing protein [Haloactinopolyspora sp.]